MISCEQIDFIACLEGLDPHGQMQRHIDACGACRASLKVVETLVSKMIQDRMDAVLDPESERKAFEPEEPDESDVAASDPETSGLESSEMALPLPGPLQHQVAVRKKNWQARQAEKTLSFLEYADEKQKALARKILLDRPEDTFLNAAFSDELLDDPDKD
jgi:hypothetical protein